MNELKSSRRRARLAEVLALGLTLAASAESATINVTTTADDNGANSSCSLREAVRSLHLGRGWGGCSYVPDGDATPDVIRLRNGTYRTAEILAFSVPAEIRGNSASESIIQGTQNFLVLRAEWGLRSGFEAGLILNNVTVRNTFSSGGGILYVSPEAKVLIKRSVLRDSGRDGWDGGAIHTLGATRVEYSTIRNNRGRLGGAVYVGSGDDECRLDLYNSTVSGNTAGLGGGIYTHCPIQIENSTISGNRATAWWGGGILARANEVGNTESYVDLTHTTVAFNTAAKQGGGIFVYPWDDVGTQTRGSIVARNSITSYEPTGWLSGEVADPDYFGCPAPDDGSFGWNLYSRISIVEDPGCAGVFPTDKIGVDPRLAALAGNGGPTQTHALNSGSPAINASSDFGVNIDQRGMSRPVGSAPDIGAFERR